MNEKVIKQEGIKDTPKKNEGIDISYSNKN
jgi:hypothetical protein